MQFQAECDQCLNVAYAFILNGISYSILTDALWPSVPLLMEPKQIGKGFGFTNAFMNLGQSISPLIVGSILSQASDDLKSLQFDKMISYFTILSFLSLILSLIISIYDFKHGRKLFEKQTSTTVNLGL